MRDGGFRADFYIGRGVTATWIGSLRHEGAPLHVQSCLRRPHNKKLFIQDVTAYIFQSRDGVARQSGWPWEYEDSSATDYTYALDDKNVLVSCYGSPWVKFDKIDCESLLDDYDFDNIIGAAPVFPEMRLEN